MKASRISAILLLISILISGCESFVNNIKDITDGNKFEEIGAGIISSQVVSLTIENDNSVFDGTKIFINQDYSGPTVDFTIESGSIPDKNFGENFNPLDEMLRIRNGGEYSDDPFFVSVQLSVTDDDIAVPFQYNQFTGKLEPVPVVSFDTNQLIFAVCQFSNHTYDAELKAGSLDGKELFADYMIALYPLSAIEKIGGVYSDFEPGEDDWEFPNYGSTVEREGNCAGHCLAAIYYYDYKNWAGAEGLNSLYDLEHSEGFWQDNTNGIRLVSQIQPEQVKIEGLWYDFASANPYSSYEDYVNKYHDIALKTAAVQLMISKQPLYTSMFKKTGLDHGHAIIITGINLEQRKIYLADPNFPGKTREAIIKEDGFIEYNGATSSGSTDNVKYERFMCLGFSGIANWWIVARAWKEMAGGTIGDDRFPECEYTMTFNIGESDENEIVMGQSDKNLLGSLSVSRNDEIIRLSCNLPSKDGKPFRSKIRVYHNSSLFAESESGKNYVDIELEAYSLHNSVLGIYVSEEYKNKKGKETETWVDFKWLIISEFTLEPEYMVGQVNEEYEWELNVGKAPANVRFEWTFGDDTGKEVIKNDYSVKHTYSKNGRYSIYVMGYNDDTDELLGVAAGTAVIQEPVEVDVSYVGISLDNIEGRPFFKYSNGSWDNAWSIGWWKLEEDQYTVVESSISNTSMSVVTERKFDDGMGDRFESLTMTGQFEVNEGDLIFNTLTVIYSMTFSRHAWDETTTDTREIELVNFRLNNTHHWEYEPLRYDMQNIEPDEVKAMIKSISHKVVNTKEGETTEYHLTGIEWDNAKRTYFDFWVEMFK